MWLETNTYILSTDGREKDMEGYGAAVRSFVISTEYLVLGKIGSGISDVVLEQSLEGFPGLRKRGCRWRGYGGLWRANPGTSFG